MQVLPVQIYFSIVAALVRLKKQSAHLSLLKGLHRDFPLVAYPAPKTDIPDCPDQCFDHFFVGRDRPNLE